MGLRDFLTKPLFGTGYDFAWSEPWLFRLRLHRDLAPRLLMGLSWTVALAAVFYVIGMGERARNPFLGPPALSVVFGGFVGLVSALGILLAPEAVFGSRVKVKEKAIHRNRTTIAIWHGLSVREWWEYPGLSVAVVPGEALGTPFAVLVLPRPRGSSEKRALIGVPPRVDLPAMLRCLADRGARVVMAPEMAAEVRAQRPYGWGVAPVVALLGLVVAVLAGGYAIRENQKGAQAGPQPVPVAAPQPAVARGLPGGLPLPPKPKGVVRQFAIPQGATVGTIALAEGGRRLVVGTVQGRVLVFDPDRDAPVADYAPHKTGVGCLAISPDGALAFSADHKEGALWDLAAEREIARFKSVPVFPAPATFSPDGRLVVFPNADDRLVVYDIAAKRERFQLKGEGLRLAALTVTADGKHLISIDSSEIRYWDLEDGRAAEVIQRLTFNASYFKIALPRDGYALFANPNQILAWDMAKRRAAAEVAIPGGAQHLGVSGDGRIGFLGREGSVGVWDLRRGVETARMECNQDDLKQITSTADGRRAATYNYATGKLFLWQPQ